MRIKNDTIIKWHILPNTMYLSNEEFGALIRNVMLDDDKKGIRYDEIPPRTLNNFKKREKEWISDLDRLMDKNPAVEEAYIKVYGQASKSHKAFKQKQKEYDIKDIMKNKECSYEEAVEIYNLQNPKIKLNNFNIFDILFSFELPENISFENKELEEVFEPSKEVIKFDEELFKNIVKDTFKNAIYDDFKKSLKEYYDEVEK